MVHPENKTTRPLPTGQNLNRAKRAGAGMARVETVTFRKEGNMLDIAVIDWRSFILGVLAGIFLRLAVVIFRLKKRAQRKKSEWEVGY